MPAPTARAHALRFVILMGLVSLFADMTYEGARGSNGQFLESLGASGAAVGLAIGLGELVAYGLRIVFGFLSDRSQRPWLIVALGYSVNILAVPLMYFAGTWHLAAAFIILERFGKAVRSPAKDAMLSHAASITGRGWGFGLHEAMDQIGALSGPLVVAAILWSGSGYHAAYAWLGVPAVLCLIMVGIAIREYPRPRDFEADTPPRQHMEGSPPGDAHAAPFPPAFWLYIAAVSLLAIGFADFALIAFHMEKTRLVDTRWIPVIYAGAMGIDGLAALAFGRLFDRIGIWAMAASVAIAAAFPIAFLGGLPTALFGIALWGIGMGAQESIMKATVARMVDKSRRATAYGILNSAWGVAWFAGSAAAGWLYDQSIPRLVIFSIAFQLAAVPVLVLVARRVQASQPRP